MKLLRLPTLVVFFLAQLHYALPFQSCPLLGVEFPTPTNLSGSSIVQNAASTLLATINNAINSGVIDSNASSFSVEIFSSQETKSLFTFHHSSPGLNSSVGVKTVDSNSIYRIGSVSKLFTVYLLLIESGDIHFHEPITNFVPELLAASQATPGDDLEYVDWSSVTIGNLASHMAGIGRDYANTGDFVNTVPPNSDFTAFGLPALNLSQFPPCVLGRNCTNRSEFFSGYLQRHPVFSPASTPVYSNSAFQILGYALEKITGKSYVDLLNDDIIQPLKLTGTSYSQPKDSSKGVIPGTPESSGWSFDIGDEGPAGSLYSSTSDMASLGRSILSSQLLKLPQTRRWMKPLTHTADLHLSIGAPWEIYRIQFPSTSRVIDLYTKNGGLGVYSSEIVLVPEWDIGISILEAGTGSALGAIFEMIAEIMGPALEAAAREEADTAYSGHYVSSDPKLNSSITITTDDSLSGLGVTSWISNGTDMLNTVALLLLPNPSIRLYSTGLKKKLSDGNSLVSWRAVIEDMDQSNATSFFPTCLNWGNVDGWMYGTIAVDDFVFTLGCDGMATIVEPRVLRSTLNRV